MPLVLPAIALFGLFGLFYVSDERRREGKRPGIIEGWVPPPHSHEALLPLELPGTGVLWVTPRHPLWCQAVAYHMGLCIKARRLREGLAPVATLELEPELGDGGPSSLARAAGVVNAGGA